MFLGFDAYTLHSFILYMFNNKCIYQCPTVPEQLPALIKIIIFPKKEISTTLQEKKLIKPKK